MEPEKKTVFALPCGKVVDLKKAIPLSIADFKELKKQGVDLVAMTRAEAVSLEQLSGMVSFICKKANPEITDQDVDAMAGSWIVAIATRCNELGNEVDGPF